MRAIIGDLLYDTKKAELMLSYREWKLDGNLLGVNMHSWHDMEMYKTPSGRYFLHDVQGKCILIPSEDEIADNYKKFDIDKYIEIYGGVEEA